MKQVEITVRLIEKIEDAIGKLENEGLKKYETNYMNVNSFYQKSVFFTYN